MAEPLIKHYGTEVPHRITDMIRDVYKDFPAEAFLRHTLEGYDELALLPRGHHIAHSLRRFLPQDFDIAIEILLDSLGPRPVSKAGDGGMAPFLYLPHTHFVACYGLDHFATAMRAQYQLTQRFTCEFSIRAFIKHHPEATLSQLAAWAQDSNEHVRRLVSEGTRPRLPWASRLPEFQRDPAPVLALLETLRDDASLYVRRSVANNLNDIGKDNPLALLDTVSRWQTGASAERQWLIRHALRSAIKAGNHEALSLLGFGGTPRVAVHDIEIAPLQACEGDRIQLALTLRNTGRREQALMVDFKVYYQKANGSINPKVFKLKAIRLAARESRRLGKTLSLAPMSTRQHYCGEHQVTLLLNGRESPLGSFWIKDADSL